MSSSLQMIASCPELDNEDESSSSFNAAKDIYSTPPRSPNATFSSLFSSKKNTSFSNSLSDPDISAVGNLTSILFHLNQENKPFNYFSSTTKQEDGKEPISVILEENKVKFTDVVMIIKLSKVISQEDNFGTEEYFLSNSV
jgi:hypothetical protein